MALQDALYRLNQMGLLDVLLPFALIFTITYAISNMVPNIGDSSKYRKVISLVVGLMVVIPHITNSYPPGMDVVTIINSAIPQVAMVIVGVILVLMLIASTGAQGDDAKFYFTWTRWVALAIVVFIFIDSVFVTNGIGAISSIPFLSWFGDGDFQAILLVILIFGLVVMFVTGGGNSQYVVYKDGSQVGTPYADRKDAQTYIDGQSDKTGYSIRTLH